MEKELSGHPRLKGDNFTLLTIKYIVQFSIFFEKFIQTDNIYGIKRPFYVFSYFLLSRIQDDRIKGKNVDFKISFILPNSTFGVPFKCLPFGEFVFKLLSVFLNSCTTKTLTKFLKKKTDGNYTVCSFD